MATMTANQYQASSHAHYGYVPPPSPPMDETSKCSLPSISNLLGLADQGSPTAETFAASQQQSQAVKLETRPSSASRCAPTLRTALPPSPPMSSDASFDGYSSPTARSIGQMPGSSNYYFEATPPFESDTRQMTIPRVPMQAPAYQQPFSASGYTAYYPPVQATPAPQIPISGLYYQRPLPQNFPPVGLGVPLGPGGGPSPWQHHHYIAPSAASAFPQTQDRYICPTCSKAFSRPSSLRIHSHSHTGEKPFKCPHAGCGKAFSVRSNMKRHERGCHNIESGSGH